MVDKIKCTLDERADERSIFGFYVNKVLIEI